MSQQMILPDHRAVRHVLGAPQIAHRTARYVGIDDFDFAGLARETETMSSGEKLLVEIASDLWNGRRSVGVVEVVRKLDQRNFERVLQAFRLARGTAVDLAELLQEDEEEQIAALWEWAGVARNGPPPQVTQCYR